MEVEEGLRMGELEKAAMSRPVVKAAGPDPERMMARQEGVCDRWVKSGGRASHILGLREWVDAESG